MNKIAPPLRNLTTGTTYIGVDQISGARPPPLTGDTRDHLKMFFFSFFKLLRKKNPEGSFLSLHASFVMDLSSFS